MKLTEKELIIPKWDKDSSFLKYITDKTNKYLKPNEVLNRFVISITNDDSYFCEIGTLVTDNDYLVSQNKSIFDFQKREYENTNEFNSVLLIPTGIGAEIGGHCGDGNVVAR